MLKLIAFDLDGTLVDAFKAVTNSINHVLVTMGYPNQSHYSVKRAVGWGEGKLLVKFVGEENKQKAYKLYQDLGGSAKDDKLQNMFEILANEELKHKSGLEGIYDDIVKKTGD